MGHQLGGLPCVKPVETSGEHLLLSVSLPNCSVDACSTSTSKPRAPASCHESSLLPQPCPTPLPFLLNPYIYPLHDSLCVSAETRILTTVPGPQDSLSPAQVTTSPHSVYPRPSLVTPSPCCKLWKVELKSVCAQYHLPKASEVTGEILGKNELASKIMSEQMNWHCWSWGLYCCSDLFPNPCLSQKMVNFV